MGKRAASLLFIFVFLLASFGRVTNTGAQSSCPPPSGAVGSVTVDRRDADITILANGDIRYEEVWQVNFQGSNFRFAFRTIPLNRATGIVDWTVSESGRDYVQGASEYGYNVSQSGGDVTIHWCFPSTTNQTRTFNLGYTVEGSLGIYENGDRYFWKFIEQDRGYSISTAKVRIHLPGSFDPGQVELAAFVNEVENLRFLDSSSGSGTLSGKSNVQVLDGSTIEFSGGPFHGGEEWEIGVKFPHGFVSAEAPLWQRVQDNAALFGLGALCLAGLLIIAGILGLYLFWYTLGRDRPVGVRAEYFPRPPEDLTPGVVGVLVDERADMEDVLATLIDLARRGFLEIQELSKSGFGRKADFQFTRSAKEIGDLLPHEKTLMRAIFPNRRTRKLSSLKNKFYSKLPEIQKELYAEVTRQGFFPTGPDKVRTWYGCAGFFLTAVVGLLAWGIYGLLSELTALSFFVSASMMIFPVGLLFAARYMPRKSPKGVRSASQWLAFKNYLGNIEKYTKVQDAQDQFEKYLPYAIAFGLEKSWVKKFTSVDAPVPLPGWYHMHPTTSTGGSGSRRGSARPAEGGGAGLPSLDDAAGNLFGGLDSMSDGLFSMLDEAASTFRSAPQSSGSGGFSGGGFSGGGGGGGGSSGFG